VLKAYIATMTRLLEQAVEAVCILPDDVPDDLARMLLKKRPGQFKDVYL
jgi:hypothetical protein